MASDEYKVLAIFCRRFHDYERIARAHVSADWVEVVHSKRSDPARLMKVKVNMDAILRGEPIETAFTYFFWCPRCDLKVDLREEHAVEIFSRLVTRGLKEVEMLRLSAIVSSR